MAYDLFLIAHIVGALATALAGFYALYVLFTKAEGRYRASAIALGTMAGLEIFTGTGLSVLSAQLTAVAVCQRFFFYLVLVGVLEAALFARMRNTSLLFPLRTVASPIIASLLTLGAAVAYGV